MQSGQDKHALVVVAYICNLTGSVSIGTVLCNCLITVLPREMKLLKGCIGMVLCQGHMAIEKHSHSCPGMTTLWVTCVVLIPHSSGVTDKIKP
jgi:hypothetical protein